MMNKRIINVKVKTSAGKNEIVQLDAANYVAYITVVPENGKANMKIIDLFSEFFRIGKSQIRIIRGNKCKIKTVEILFN